MSFSFSFDAAALMSARTRFRVAFFVSRLVTLVNPWAFAKACMSFASNSHAVSCPSHPLYCLGSTALRPMWREAPVGISDPFVLDWTPILNQNGASVQDDLSSYVYRVLLLLPHAWLRERICPFRSGWNSKELKKL